MRRAPVLLGVIGTGLIVLVNLLPLTPVGGGVFGNFLAPVGGNGRIIAGVLLFDIPYLVAPVLGIVLVFAGRAKLAAGVFVGAALFCAGRGLAEPFLSLPRVRSFLTLALYLAASLVFGLAAWLLVRTSGRRALPPPPPQGLTPSRP